MSFGARLKEARVKAGLQQNQLAALSGISLRTIQNWESGTNKCPEYTAELIEYKLNKEGMIKGEA